MRFHPLQTDIGQPQRFNNPFCYEPHPLCQLAAGEVRAYLEAHADIREDADKGKMFGVLVVERNGEPGYLAAYSGLLAGRNDWEWFVPPVYDAQQPDGHFKQEERAISELNRRIEAKEREIQAAGLHDHMRQTKEEFQLQVEEFKRKMQSAKLLRDARRLQHHLSPEESAELERESQFLKAELHRMKQRHGAIVGDLERQLEALDEEVARLKQERKARSEVLQSWLFRQYRMLNARGERKDLMEIFGGMPPAGSGDCCAPKLLQYAYEHALRPLCMAEFWWGESPVREIRHHLQYYPACRGKCMPILGWMLEGMDVESMPDAEGQEPTVVYEDDSLVVVNKPAGMLSVPGKIRRESVEGFFRRQWRDEVNPIIVHRLDMETSGLMVVARTKWIHSELQRQFARHEVEKEYVAIVDGIVEGCGEIRLPLCPDYLDRPRQTVDYDHGKEAVTEYEVLSIEEGRTRIALRPRTGRTHQLRVHCAHRDGLNAPIRGDELYGKKADRLYLHAQKIAFTHPKTGKRMEFTCEADF